jgi:plastocyanin domain-containing protein
VKTVALLFASLVLGSLAVGCDKGGEASAASAQGTQTVQPAQQPAAPSEAASGRIVDIAVTDKGFEPSTVAAKKGETVSLRFTRTTQSECLKAITIPSLNIKKDLPMNQPVIANVLADKEGKIVFQCWMAMVKGEIDVKG